MVVHSGLKGYQIIMTMVDSGGIGVLAAVAEALASVIALVLSAIALDQSRKQIEVTNKQSLFNRRLDAYSMTRELLDQFELYRNLRMKTSVPNTNYAIDFSLLAPYSLFRDAKECICFPEATSSLQNAYSAIKALGRVSEEAGFIFPYETGLAISSFIENLASYLYVMYRYEQRSSKVKESYPDANTEVNQEAPVKNDAEAVETAYRKLDRCYAAMIERNILAQAEAQIKLC